MSTLLATRLATHIDLICTIVITHLPSNILLILVPLIPNLLLAVLILLLRFSINQMDVPTRQSYTRAVVPAEERCGRSHARSCVSEYTARGPRSGPVGIQYRLPIYFWNFKRGHPLGAASGSSA